MNYWFTGKERDSESGNDYFGAKYYASSMGRFMSPDNGIDQDQTNPQSWNLYSYVRNNPLSRIDPNGRLTIIAGGTGWSTANWNDSMKFANEARQYFHDSNVIVLNRDQWSGAYNQDAMDHGAQSVRDIVAGYNFGPGEQLNLIGHSRGADLDVEATNGITHKVDNLITLAMPNDPLIQADTSNIGTWINVETAEDLVKFAASDSYAPNPTGARNLTFSAPGYGPISAHTAIWKDDSLRQQWWSYWSQHQGCQSWVTTDKVGGGTETTCAD
jgi:RHS repeat-associated protein